MKTINWSGYEWITQERWGDIHPEKTYCWYDEHAVSIDANSHLHLKTRYNPKWFKDKGLWSNTGVGLVSCTNKFKHGTFEIEAKLPNGLNLWPAFWMLGSNSDTAIWPQCGEIDIMEYLGSSPTKVFGTVHGPGYSGGNAITKTYTLSNSRFDTDFHVFGVEWDENYINFYVDNVLYNQITPSDVTGDWVFNNPFYMILNMAVGVNYPGAPNSETPFPQEMLVDYVRVYQ
mgnify:CR=1 FL=1